MKKRTFNDIYMLCRYIYYDTYVYDKSSKFFWKNDLAKSIFLNETNSC